MAIISKLASSQYLTDKHWDKRNESQIKYIIPHHMAGMMTGAGCAKYFVNNGYDNSANYCIGYNGDISCNVPEQYGAWTSSWWRVDTKGITIEVSNSSNTDSDWPISNASKEALIRLMVDFFQRYPSLGGKAIFDPSDEYEVVAFDDTEVTLYDVKFPLFNKTYSKEELTEASGVSYKKLTTMFKAETGQTLHAYQIGKKLEMVAMHIDSEPYVRMKELAANYDFYDEFYLSKLFKKKYGMSPQEYKTNSKSKRRKYDTIC